MSSIFRKPLTRKVRKTFIVGADGGFVPDPTTTDTTIQASVQPLRPHEVQTLEEFFDIKIIDIYPPSLNKWKNTHHYAFICKLRESNHGKTNKIFD